MKFGVIIVTYNRLSLLQECLLCVFDQTVPFHRILVVDNHSTDGTAQYLDSIDHPALSVLHLPENIGGAGGFARGLKEMAKSDCDWVLIIDDDAMISPIYMEEISRAIAGSRYLAYSGTVETEGAIDGSHRRLLVNRCLMTYRPVPESAYQGETFVYDVSTFCGLVLKTSLIRRIGLPKANYFIWFDDTEYCLRFRKYSRILNVCGAKLNHRTVPPSPHPVTCWKNFYGFRNAIDIGRRYSSHPQIFLACTVCNHLAHIAIDGALALLGNRRPERLYRMKIYRDVLTGMKRPPDGIDRRYPPGSGFQK